MAEIVNIEEEKKKMLLKDDCMNYDYWKDNKIDFNLLENSNTYFLIYKELALFWVTYCGSLYRYLPKKLQNDYDILLKALSYEEPINRCHQNGREYNPIEDAPEYLKNMKELAILAIKEDSENFKFIGEELKNNEQFCYNTLIMYNYIYKDLPQEFKDKYEFNIIVGKSGIIIPEDPDERFILSYYNNKGWGSNINKIQNNNNNKNNKNIYFKLFLKKSDIYHYLPTSIKEDKKLIILCLKENGKILNDLNIPKSPKDLILLKKTEILNHRCIKFRQSSLLLNLNKELEEEKIINDCWIEYFKHLLDEYKIKYENFFDFNEYYKLLSNNILYKENKKDNIIFEIILENLKEYYNYTYYAVKQNGLALQYAINIFQNDKVIVEEAVNNNNDAKIFASPTILKKFYFSELLTTHTNEPELTKYQITSIIYPIINDKNYYKYKDLAEKYKKDFNLALTYLGNSENIKYIKKELLSDIEFVKLMIKKNVQYLEYASEDLLNNKELIIEACKINFNSINYMTEELKNDVEFLIELCEYTIEALYYLDEIGDYHELKKVTIKNFLQKDGMLINNRNIYKWMKNSLEYAKLAINNNPFAFQYLSKKLKNIFELGLLAVTIDPKSIVYLSLELQDNEEIGFKVVENYGMGFKDLGKTNQKNSHICLKAVLNDGLVLQYVTECVDNYDTICKEAIKQNGLAYNCLSNTNKLVYEYACLIVSNNGLLLKYVPNEIIDQKLINLAIENNPRAYEFVPFIFRTFELTEMVVGKDGTIIEFISDDFFLDIKLLSSAIKQNPSAIYFIPENIFEQDVYLNELVIPAITQDGLLIKYFPFEYNDILILKAIKQNIHAIKYMDIKHIHNVEVVKKIVKYTNYKVEQFVKLVKEYFNYTYSYEEYNKLLECFITQKLNNEVEILNNYKEKCTIM